MLVALPVGEVQQAVGDPRGRAVRGDVGEPRRDQRHGTIHGDLEVGHGRAEDLEPRRERIGVEGERAGVLEPLIQREIRRDLIGAPAAGVEPDGLRGTERQRHLGAGLGRQARPVEP